MSKSPLEAHRASFVRNLLALYHNASTQARADGASWYPDARRIVNEWSATYELSRERVASVVAALSPQCEWSRNLIIADDILAERAVSVGGALHVNIGKARTLRQAQRTYLAPTDDAFADMLLLFPCGPKVNCFARNLAGDDTIVTVDTHAIQAAFDDVRVTINPKWTPYRIIAECYAVAAREVAIPPATFQAIIWHAWKETHSRVSKIQDRKRW